MCLTLALISAFYYDKIQVSLVLFIFLTCNRVEKVKKSEKTQNHVRVMYLYGMCLVFQKKKELFRISLFAYKHVLHKSLCS